MDRCDESRQFLAVEYSIRAHAAADVDSARADAMQRLGDIGGTEPAGEKDRDAGIAADAPADRPVVNASRAAELLHAQRRIAGVEEERVGVARGANRLVIRCFAGNVDDL